MMTSTNIVLTTINSKTSYNYSTNNSRLSPLLVVVGGRRGRGGVFVVWGGGELAVGGMEGV